MGTLDVLYQSSDAYSMITTVSIASLCYNNQDLSDLNINLVSDGISEENLVKIKSVCDRFSRKLDIIDAQPIKECVIEMGVRERHGSYAHFFKYFAFDMLHTPSGRALYLDSDTIIDRSISELVQFDLRGSAMALPRCFTLSEYKERLGLDLATPYLTPGVFLVDLDLYRERSCLDRFLEHGFEHYAAGDEEIVNIEFGGEAAIMPSKYNFYPNFYVYGVDNMFAIYDLDGAYETKDEVRAIMEEGPHIMHCLGLLTGRPWEMGNRHPYGEAFDCYLAMTDWGPEDKWEPSTSVTDKVQGVLFKVMPSPLYCKVHRAIYRRLLNSHLAK